MKKLLFAVQLPLFLALNFFIFTTILEFTGAGSLAVNNIPLYNQKEEFDPQLARLNSIKKLELYCDSLVQAKASRTTDFNFEEQYPGIVVSAVRKRFYHGYSSFSLANNYAAVLFEPLTGKKLGAIVLPEDIMKHPNAACSQQSIVVMNILGRKGFKTRTVGFQGKKNGHFSFETYYNGSWHFFDPNMEPDPAVLEKYNYPDIAFLAAHPSVLLEAYRDKPKEMVLDIFTNYHYKQQDVAQAPWATLYQQTTYFLSYTLWLFFLMAFIWVRKKHRSLSTIQHVRNNRIFISKVHRGTPQVHYQYHTA